MSALARTADVVRRERHVTKARFSKRAALQNEEKICKFPRLLVERLSLLICPSGGLLTGLSSLISDFPKNISVPTHPKSHLELCASHPTRGAYHDRHERGVGCGGRGSVLRAMGLQGG
jgi:hypothetical protein